MASHVARSAEAGRVCSRRLLTATACGACAALEIELAPGVDKTSTLGGLPLPRKQKTTPAEPTTTGCERSRTWTGRVLLCCGDVRFSHCFGDISITPVAGSWDETRDCFSRRGHRAIAMPRQRQLRLAAAYARSDGLTPRRTVRESA